MANSLAVNVPNLNAAVAFYGRQATAADVPKITAAVQLHYAGLDERINTGIKDYEEALKANNKTYELHMYDAVNHSFHNDTQVLGITTKPLQNWLGTGQLIFGKNIWCSFYQ